VTPKLNVGTGKTGYTRTRDHLTRPVKRLPDPYTTRGYGSGTSKPAGMQTSTALLKVVNGCAERGVALIQSYNEV